MGPWVAIFATALALRVLAILAAARLDPGALGVSADFAAVAESLARGGGFALDDGSGPRPTASQPPLGPWLASLAGAGFATGLPALLFLQAVVGALVPLLLGTLSAAMFGGGVGRLAAWLAAASPVLVLAGLRLDHATLLVALVLGALAASASWVKTPRPGRALGVGLLFGLATLAHPLAVLLPAVVAAWAWTPLGLTLAPGDRARQVGLVALGLLAAVAPWALRNAVALRTTPVLTTAAGRAFLEGNVPAERPGAAPPKAAGPGEARRDREAWAAAWSSGRARDWPAAALGKLARLASPAAFLAAQDRSPRPALAVAVGAWWLAIAPLALYGLARTLASARRWFQSLPALVLLYAAALALAFHPARPVRLPIEAVALLFAAAGFEDARRRLRTRGRGLTVIEGRR